MMQKAWNSIEEVHFYFSRSSIKFQSTVRQKSLILAQIESLQTVTLVWIHQWFWNDAQSLIKYRRGAVLFF